MKSIARDFSQHRLSQSGLQHAAGLPATVGEKLNGYVTAQGAATKEGSRARNAGSLMRSEACA